MSKKTFVYCDTEYKVPDKVVEKLENLGVNFNDAYISYLFDNSSPFWSNDLSFLAILDLRNKLHIGLNGTLGRIVRLNKRGDVSECFDTVYDAVIDSFGNNDKYTFEKFHLNNVKFKKQTYDFFGLKINATKHCNFVEIIKLLNRTITRCKNKQFGKNKTFQELYSEKIASQMSYEEYVERGIRWETFCIGNNIHDLLINSAESEYTKHNIECCDDYYDRMVSLLMRYSIGNFAAFEQVFDLNDVSCFKGIYLLCLPHIKGCYVGQTKLNFKDRITQHFTNPNSSFDNKFNPNDIESIFILPLDETMMIIDAIEEDCIAVLGKEVCLNAMAGGKSIELIKTENYAASKHLLSHDIIRWVIEDSKNITEYIRDCKEIEEMYHE